MQIEHFFDPDTSTLTYIVADMERRQCAVVDSVLDFDPKSGRTSTRSADRVIARVRELNLEIAWILETHVHADHLSAAPHIKEQLGGRTAVGARITDVQIEFARLFNAGALFACDGRQFDCLLEDGEVFNIGAIGVRALHTPGHTPACVTYVMEHNEDRVAFVGDTLFMPDFGTARCDFPGGSASTLYRSIKRLLALPESTVLYMCHDYQPGGRELRCSSTVAHERQENVHVHDGVSEVEFVRMRTARDATLSMPALLLPSVQVNMRAGNFPLPEPNGRRYLKIPIDAI